jgi:hypothetical protein
MRTQGTKEETRRNHVCKYRIVKLKQVKDKKKILKTSEEKEQLTYY